MKPTITLTLGADDNFSMPLTVTLCSFLEHLSIEYLPVIYILDGGISERNKRKIEKCAKEKRSDVVLHWRFYNVSDLGQVSTTKEISRAAYLRILIPTLLPLTEKAAIYLDCDLIIEKDLSKLWETSFDDKVAIGVEDYCKELHLDTSFPYCNSGVIYMNLDLWRKHNLSYEILSYLKETGRLDQDGINAIIKNRWKTIDPKWNVTLSSINYIEDERMRNILLKDAFIIHYTSRHKPWQSGFGNKEALLTYYFQQNQRSRFFHYLKKSGWYSKLYFNYWLITRQLPMLLFKLHWQLKHSIRH